MSDIIRVLPDSVANQIAAGEVIQRPASAVKELLENAIDAGSSFIRLIVKDAGKTLIQIIDNGSGMSETDARLCFERHATSKIREPKDLFGIRTMGFRGEALASIAAIAQVEMKSKRTGDELGTKINIEGSKVTCQEPFSCPEGTSVAAKNLFYNVPARRNFLKPDPVELRHIIDEFQRVSIANPKVAFSVHHNGNELFHLDSGGDRQRIVGIFGKNYNQRLVPVEEKTNLVELSGFVGKPDFARKTKGEQFFFVNKRFIKSGYLHYAVQNAFNSLISKESYASYFIFLDIDPKTIDINIHPTKTEIKFENEKAIYAILHSAVKQALGKYNIAPVLDFNSEMTFQIPPKPVGEVKPPSIRINPDFNPFKPDESQRNKSNMENWEKLFEKQQTETTQHIEQETEIPEINKKNIFQLHNRYILAQISSGLLVIDQQFAHERVLYEKFLNAIKNNRSISQKQLFSQTVELSPVDFSLVKELEEEIKMLGFDIREFGKNTYVIDGIPAEVISSEGNKSDEESHISLLEAIIGQYKENMSQLKLEKRDNIARSLAKRAAIKSGKKLAYEEICRLIDELFACKMPYYTPGGNTVISSITLKELETRFKK